MISQGMTGGMTTEGKIIVVMNEDIKITDTTRIGEDTIEDKMTIGISQIDEGVGKEVDPGRITGGTNVTTSGIYIYIASNKIK